MLHSGGSTVSRLFAFDAHDAHEDKGEFNTEVLVPACSGSQDMT